MRRFVTGTLVLAALALLGITPALAQTSSGVLNIYSSRHYGDMETAFVAFTQATGIEVRVSAGSPQDLLGRLRADIARGGRSIADLFLAIDAGVLSLAAEEGLLQPVSSDVLNANIDPAFRDPGGSWYGLSVRTRTVVYNPLNVTDDELAQLNDYRDLANPVWQGRLCMRPASHIYTISFFSSLLYHLGEEEALAVTQGIVANVTRYINSDTSLIQAVAAGECDVTLVNHYYMGRLANGSDADKAVFGSVALRWMNQDSTGVFFNVNGAGIIANAANYDNALRFLEFMSAVENQCGASTCFPGSNYEFPTNPAADVHPTIADFGTFSLDLMYPLWDYGAFQTPTVDMLQAAGFGFTEN